MDEPRLPDHVHYGFDLWARQVADFVAAVVLAPSPDHEGGAGSPSSPPELHLIGNSIGAVVALRAAQLLLEQRIPVAQVVLIDCAQRSLDQKRLPERPPWERAGRPLLRGLVRQRWLLTPLFRLLARPPVIRQVLAQAYPTGANVDDALVALLHGPACSAGALESFRGFVNLFEDHLAPDLLAQLELPVRLLWGERDPWEDPAEARRWADTYPCVQELRLLPGLGHCPHDEAPEVVNPILRTWITAPSAFLPAASAA